MTTDAALSDPGSFSIRAAELRDVAAIVQLIRELADFENLTHLLQVTPEKLRPHLFGERAVVEALVAESQGEVVGLESRRDRPVVNISEMAGDRQRLRLSLA